MSATREPWKKTLYGNVGYPDNYTDPSFLKDLQKNKNVKIITFLEAVRGASLLNHQISCITLFLLIFYSMYANDVAPKTILVYSTGATLIGYVIFCWQNYVLTILKEDLKTVLTVLIFGYIFSPMLHTLTNSISTDTIFATTFFVMILHLVFFDYGLPAFIVSKAISLNAAIFGSICLASRLATSFHAFTLLVVSTEFFVLLPILLKTYWTPLWVLPMAMICSYYLLNISIILLIIYLLLLFFINIICPYIFVYQQKHKNNIHGPWDEAIVKDQDIVQK